MSLPVCTKDEKAVLATALERVKFNSPYGKDMKRWLRHGIGVHHAGLLPKYRILVERSPSRACSSSSAAPTPSASASMFRSAPSSSPSSGNTTARRPPSSACAISARSPAGPAAPATTTQGYVIVQAPEHLIENKRAEEKAAGDPAKKKKLVKARAPEGSVGWDAKTFERLQTAPPEELSPGSICRTACCLLVLSRDSDGCRAMRQLIADCHETPTKKRALRKRAWQLFRALLDRKIVEIIPRPAALFRPPPSRQRRAAG
jgi:hypothetical protein